MALHCCDLQVTKNLFLSVGILTSLKKASHVRAEVLRAVPEASNEYVDDIVTRQTHRRVRRNVPATFDRLTRGYRPRHGARHRVTP